mmetsp:Transcript_50634/g.120822  ORF Transcript_50634/g.120822 Transcript_50634/m.120822 type:complete len:456 (+) Transcript_50634:57-1424(+)
MAMRIFAFAAVLRSFVGACDEACMREVSGQEDVGSDAALELLQHSVKVSAASSAGARVEDSVDPPAPCNPTGPIQVFSDVDDTFTSSGGSWPAGCDGVYEKSVIYPGYAQFVLEVSRGPNESLRVLRPALFSARPESFDFLKVDDGSPMAAALAAPSQGKEGTDPVSWDYLNAEIQLDVPELLVSYDYQQGGIEKLLNHDAGQPFGLNVDGSKYGHLSDFTNTHSMGETKFENFQEFYLEEASAQSDEACVIFIGDDGQGDCNPAAQEMRRYAKHGRHELGLKAAFIHRLTCDSKPLNCASATASPGSAPVIMFDDYLDAARKAEQHGLISAAGAQRVRTAVALFFAVYCKQDGTGRLTETLGDLGCRKLRDSLSQGTGPAPSQEALNALRPMQRLQTWCKSCCNGSISNHRTTYNFQKKKMRCHHMYQEDSWWHLWSKGASDSDCRSHCSSISS